MPKLYSVPNIRHYLRVDTAANPLHKQARFISSASLHNIRSWPGSNRRLLTKLQPSWPTLQTSPAHFNPPSSRFASTVVGATPIADVKPVYSSTASQPISDASLSNESSISGAPNLIETPSSLDYIFEDEQPQVNEYIGFLKDMGLEYGWGPTSTVETLLEYIHIYSGTAWWVTIALTTLTIRLALFRLYVKAQDASARQAAIQPLVQPLERQLKTAMATSDMEEVRAINRQRSELYKQYGIKRMALFLPIAIQAPMGFGLFRLVRGMAALPVPGFDEGGFWWLSDLTFPDPLYILPAATAMTYYFTFKLGGETGGAASNMSPALYRLFLYFLPAMTGIFAIWWPVALQIPIFLNGVFAITQNTLFRQPGFRAFCGIQPLGIIRSATTGPTKINRGVQAAKPGPKGFVNSVKKAYGEVVEKGKEFAGGPAAKATMPGRSTAEVKKAKAYEEKIAREVAQRKFEAKQAKEARDKERWER